MNSDTRKTIVALILIVFAISACNSTPASTPHPGSRQEDQPRIEIQPEEPLIDESVVIRLYGFEPGQEVTLRARMQDDIGQTWESHAVFVADKNGFVDVSTQAPLSGDYKGIDPMGLFWSMSLQSRVENSHAFENTYTSPKYTQLKAEIEGEITVLTQIKRSRVSPEVSRSVVREDGLFGTLYLPDGEGPFPAVIVLGGAFGGLNENRAALLASHGYAALALAYFRAGHLPRELVEIPLEYFEDAIAWLQSQEKIDGDRLAVMGTSRGGELALLLGSTFPEIKAVIGCVPSGLIFPGEPLISLTGGETRAAWTYNGNPIPYVQNASLFEYWLALQIGQYFTHDGFGNSLFESIANDANRKMAIIPVERINGPILLISAGDDETWPSTFLSEIAMHRLSQYEHPFPYEHLRYPGAGHVIFTPFVPPSIGATFHPFSGKRINLGGNAKDTACANEDSWAHVLEFLAESLTVEEGE